MAGGHQRLWRGPLLDQSFQQGIQLAVVRQRVAVLLVWPQFSAGGFAADRLPHQVPLLRQPQLLPAVPGCWAVDPVAQREDAGLVQIADHRQTAVHVAVEGAIPHRQLGFVARGQEQLALLVGHGHQQRAADAGLQVLGGDPLRLLPQGRRERGVEPLHQPLNRQRVGREVQAIGQGGGIVDRS